MGARIDLSHCRLSPWQGSNFWPWRYIVRDFSRADHALPAFQHENISSALIFFRAYYNWSLQVWQKLDAINETDWMSYQEQTQMDFTGQFLRCSWLSMQSYCKELFTPIYTHHGLFIYNSTLYIHGPFINKFIVAIDIIKVSAGT